MKKTIIVFGVLVLAIVSVLHAQPIYKFDFGEGKVAKGYKQVVTTSKYDPMVGYGFELSQVLESKVNSGGDALAYDYITSKDPFFFSVRLPEGNYNVKVIVGDTKGRSVTTIKAECRRLMIPEISTENGKTAAVSFTVHIRDSIIRATNKKVRLKPREFEYLHWDDKLTLEFNNKDAKICGVEIEKVDNLPTIFLAGNSTVVDQSQEPWASWGQMFPSFFQPGKVSVGNYAESGETMLSFKGARRLEKIWSMSKPGDYLFMEFAHNDQKPGGNHLDPFTTYATTLKEWIKEARARQMHPVLVTSTNRRTFDSTGHIYNSLGDYPEAMRRVGLEENVPVIDLNAMSKSIYEALGPDESVKAFVHFAANKYPNQSKDVKDNTHFSTYGAYELSKAVVEGVRKSVPALAGWLLPGLPKYDPAHPAKFSDWNWQPSPFTAIIKPDGN